MAKKTTRELVRMGRRRFLQSLAGLGISGASLQYMTKDALAELTDNPAEEVPLLQGFAYTNHEEMDLNDAPPKREPIYSTISRDRWEIIKSARDAREQVQKEVTASTSLDTDVQATTTSGPNGGPAIIVPYPTVEKSTGEVVTPNDTYSRVVDTIPSKVAGIAGRGTEYEYVSEDIPVIVEPERVKFTAYGGYYRPVPGGCRFTCFPDGGGGCTLTMPKYDRDLNEWAFVTAGHCLNNGDERKAHQPQNQNYVDSRIGTRVLTEVSTGAFDAGVINRKSGVGKKMALAASGNDYKWRIAGTMSKSWLQNLENRGDNLRYQGRRTGNGQGRVTRVGSANFDTKARVKGGDSGGPQYYLQSDNDVWVGGLVSSAVFQGGNYKASRNTIMQTVENRFNLA